MSEEEALKVLAIFDKEMQKSLISETKDAPSIKLSGGLESYNGFDKQWVFSSKDVILRSDMHTVRADEVRLVTSAPGKR